MKNVSSPDTLGSLEILHEVKIIGEGNISPPYIIFFAMSVAYGLHWH